MIDILAIANRRLEIAATQTKPACAGLKHSHSPSAGTKVCVDWNYIRRVSLLCLLCYNRQQRATLII